MKRFNRLLSQGLRSAFCWGLSSAQGVSLGVLFLTLVFPPRYLLADQPAGPLPAAAALPAKVSPDLIPARVPPPPHRLGAPIHPGPVAVDKWEAIADRKPDEAGLYKSSVSLKALDLKQVLTEGDLRRAGQMGSPLTPTGPAKPAKISDPAKRKRQEADNMLFGEAIQKWNQHDYKGAVALFSKHRLNHPDSPWAGEAELHLGCEAQFSGSWEEARVHFDQVLSAMPKGTDIYQKVKLRRAVLHMDQGNLDLAAQAFSEMLQTETDWQRRTYAQRWLLDLSHFKGHELALRTCGSDSIAYVLRSQGKVALAAKVAKLPAPTEQGFSVRALADLASKSGLAPVTVRAEGTNDLGRLPIPFIAHYRDQHFVVVNGIADNGDVRLYDPRLERETRLSAEVFRQQWSELAIIFEAKPEGMTLASGGELDEQMGGCCGIPRYPSGLGNSTPGCNCGMPGWWVNPVNLNVCVSDTPMWHDNQFGPKVEFQLTYNSQDSLVQMRPVGHKWVLNYASYAMESPGNQPSGSVLIVMPDGRGDIYQPVSGGYTSPGGVFNTLTKTAAYSFNVALPDGTTYRYGVPPEMGANSFSSLLLSVTDRFGNAVTIFHNTDGSIHQVSDPLNNQWNFIYNSQGYVDHITDPFSRQATFSYDGTGNLTGQTDMGGVSYGYTYDSNVDLTSLIKPSGTTQFYIEPADGTNNSANPYPAYGAAMWQDYRITVTDPQGYLTRQDARTNTTSYQYLLNGVVGSDGFDLATVTDPLLHTRIALGYDAARNVNSITDATSNTTQLTYTSTGQADILTNAALHAFKVNYNPLHQVSSISQGANTLRWMTYDSVGRLQSDTDVDGHTLIYEYDNLDRITKTTYPDGTFAQNSYSCCWLDNQKDRLGRTTYYTRDFRGSPLVTQDATNRLVQSLYDPVGNLVELCDGNNNTTQWTYDARNRVSNKIYADGSTYSYVYDGAGNLSSRTDAKVVTVNYTYDANNNLTGITAPGLTAITYAYDVRNWLSQMTDSVGATAYGYDLAGRRNSITGPLDNDTISLGYDAMGRVANQNVNGSLSTATYNDSLERLTSSTAAVGAFSYAYRTASSGQLSSVAYPNGQTTVLSYYGANQDNRLSQLANNASGANGLLSQFNYQYDAAGEITQWTQQAGTGHPLIPFVL